MEEQREIKYLALLPFIPATDAGYRFPSGHIFRSPAARVIDYEKA
jgi:hypothetical protein